MADELIDVVNENNELTGERVMKSRAHKKGIWHRTVHIWFYNSKGEALLQLRAKDKELHPDMWDISVAGHIAAGEKVIVSALREIEEEIGIEIKEEDLNLYEIRKKRSKYRDIINNEFCYVYFYKFNGQLKDLRFVDSEVQKVKFIHVDDLEPDLEINFNKYVPHKDYWYDVIKHIRATLR